MRIREQWLRKPPSQLETESVEISNRHWLLRVGVDGWLNPGYLLNLERNLPLADEVYAYELALAA